MAGENDNAQAGETTLTSGDTGEETSFDQEFAAFLGHTFEDGEEEAPAEEAPKAGEEKPAEEKPADPQEKPKEEGTSGDPTPAVSPPAPGTETSSGEPVVDQALLAEMLGLADTKPAPAAKASGEGDLAKPATSTTSTDDEPYTPFHPNFELPKEMVSALFEAEDTATRHKALVGLLASFGNTLTQVMDQRIAEHHAPRLTSGFTRAQEATTIQQTVQTDFYSAHADLQPYGKAVKKAFEVIAAKDPTAPYSPELRDQVANLARAAVRAAGVQLADPKKPDAAKPAEKKKAVKPTPFEAGSARPGGVGDNKDTGPADLVAQLSVF